MNSINKLFDYRRMGYLVAAFAVLLATALPSLAFAAQVTERSIELSSSTKSATAVKYTVSFKSVAAAGAFVIDFCTSPAVGAACTAPAGLNATSAASTDFTDVTGSTNKIVVEETIGSAATVTGEITGITNPSSDGVFYARIITFDTAVNAALYDSTSAGPTNNPGTGALDQGGVAMSITPKIGVSGAVLETLIFCASAAALSPNCVGATAPSVVLGTDGVLGNVLSEGTVHTQISTNAVSGAIVNLKSSAIGCGGLLRDGAGTAAERCGIAPRNGTAATIADGASLFGVRLAALDNGTGTVAASGGYSTGANFFMNYVVGDATGVTSTYGDPIYNTVGAPISNGEADLVFGANIGNDTPAGAYAADLSLIATGKF